MNPESESLFRFSHVELNEMADGSCKGMSSLIDLVIELELSELGAYLVQSGEI
jgi:hypothetical protein